MSYFRYADGSGGCDGCLNWEGVGARFAPITRELSLPSSPNLPRIHVQDFDPKSKVSEGNYHHALNRKVVVSY